MPITGFEPESSVNCATTTVLTIKMFQRELKLREAEVQKLLEEKDEEGRLAREELELRVQALTNGDESKSKLLRDLELRLQSAVADGAKFKSATESLNMKGLLKLRHWPQSWMSCEAWTAKSWPQ